MARTAGAVSPRIRSRGLIRMSPLMTMDFTYVNELNYYYYYIIVTSQLEFECNGKTLYCARFAMLMAYNISRRRYCFLAVHLAKLHSLLNVVQRKYQSANMAPCN
jgi:hypothetical protein